VSPDVTVGLLGLGVIADTHLAVLAQLPAAQLSFVVDPAPVTAPVFRGRTPPLYRSLDEALGEHQPPNVIVIATPTSTHAELTQHALEATPARVLVEKPLVDDLDALRQLESACSATELRTRVFVAHHFAFSPEVRWGAHQLGEHPEWGPVTRIVVSFHDAYITDAAHSFQAYTSSWVDSGVNQLSMLSRFVDLVDRGPLQEWDGGATSWCTASFRSVGHPGTAALRTSWQAIASSKRTTLYLDQSGVEIWLDNTAVTGFVTRNGELFDQHVNDGSTPRKQAHYRPLWQSLLSDTPDPILSFDAASRIIHLLHREV
jgi:predicted dehydrogenase